MTPKVQKKRKTANKQDSSSTFSSSSISASSSSSSSSLQQEEQTVEETPVIASASEEASLSTQKSLDVYLTEQFNQGDDEEEEEEEVEMSSVLQHNSQEYNYNALSEYSEEESNSYYSLNGQSLTGSAGLSTAPTSSDSSPSVSPVLQTSSLHTSSFNFPQYQQTVVAPSSTSLWSSGYQQIQRVPSSVHSSPILRGSQLALHFMEDEEPETFPVSQPQQQQQQQQQQEQQPQKQVEQPQKQVAKSPAIKSEKLVITFDEVHNSFPMENLKKRKTTSPPTIMEHSFHIHEVKIEKKDSSSSLSTSDDTEKLRTKKSQKNSLKEKPNKVFQCNFEGCGKIFKRAEHLKRHTRIHTGEKPYVCRYENCGKSFSRMDNLSQHVKVHSMKTTKDKLDDVEENGDIEFDSESSGGKDSPISME